MSNTDYICAIEIDDSGLPATVPEVEQERRVAVFDLLECNSFSLSPRAGRDPPNGPYKLFIGMRGGRVMFDVSTEDGTKATEFHMSLSPFAEIIKNYFAICASYFDAVKRLPPSRIEAIDMGRRGIHNEGARLLVERLEGKAGVDLDTARRLFTLICVLQTKR